jgi:two-component system, response regulator
MITILIADDDPDDRELTRDALQECRLANDVHFVEENCWTT